MPSDRLGQAGNIVSLQNSNNGIAFSRHNSLRNIPETRATRRIRDEDYEDDANEVVGKSANTDGNMGRLCARQESDLIIAPRYLEGSEIANICTDEDGGMVVVADQEEDVSRVENNLGEEEEAGVEPVSVVKHVTGTSNENYIN